jgi:hypothetical protein
MQFDQLIHNAGGGAASVGLLISADREAERGEGMLSPGLLTAD